MYKLEQKSVPMLNLYFAAFFNIFEIFCSEELQKFETDQENNRLEILPESITTRSDTYIQNNQDTFLNSESVLVHEISSDREKSTSINKLGINDPSTSEISKTQKKTINNSSLSFKNDGSTSRSTDQKEIQQHDQKTENLSRNKKPVAIVRPFRVIPKEQDVTENIPQQSTIIIPVQESNENNEISSVVGPSHQRLQSEIIRNVERPKKKKKIRKGLANAAFNVVDTFFG